jgi:CBS domain containing-hemolysin-like protein
MAVTTATLLAVAAVAGLVVASAFLSSAEIAVFSLSDHRLATMSTSGAEGRLRRLREDPHRLLVTILVGNNVVNVTIATVTTALTADLLGASADSGLAVAVSTVVVSVVVLVFGEIAPKSYAVGNAESWSLRVAGPLSTLQRAIRPVTAVFDLVTRAVGALTGAATDIERPYVTREQIAALVRTAERLGVLGADEEAMVRGVFDLHATSAGEVMVPRVDVVGVDASAGVAAAVEACGEHRVTRLPVYEGDLDHVVGYVDLRDLVAARDGVAPAEDDDGDAGDLRALLRPVVHVYESRPVDDLLVELQDERLELAVVVDEFGTTEGLVTVEDITEEVVGEVFDVGEEPAVVALGPGRASARGDATVEAAGRAVGVRTDDDRNLSAAVYDALGRPPDPGETVGVDGLRLTVRAVADNRILRVLVERGESTGGGTD